MSDTNKITIEFSKDFQPLIEVAVDDFKQYLKDKVQNKLLIEQAKIKANKEKWNADLKTLNRNGALDKLIFQLANKFIGESIIKTNEDLSSKIRNSKFTRVKNLISLITELNKQINIDSNFKVYLNSEIKLVSVHESIYNLLKCTSEDDARLILKYIQCNITADDLQYLIKLNDTLTNSEKELVKKIVNFNV